MSSMADPPRAALRPLRQEATIAENGGLSPTRLGPMWPEKARKTVIASEAKQSMVQQGRLDCFVASLLAMTESGLRSHPGLHTLFHPGLLFRRNRPLIAVALLQPGPIGCDIRPEILV